jgi:undecaprenyl-diphosphatase
MNQTNTERKRANRWLKLFSAEFVTLLLLLFASVLVFVYAVNMVFIKKTTSFDENVFTYISQHYKPLHTDFMVFISFLGKHTFLIPANLVLLAFYLFIRKNKRLTVRISALALTSLSLMFMLKLSFQRTRPEIPLLEKVSGFSFPSGHALMSVAFYGLLIYITWQEIKQPLIRNTVVFFLSLLILLIGFSRVYLRVHYASDVIAGFAVGFAWLLLSLWVIDKLEKRYLTRKELINNS